VTTGEDWQFLRLAGAVVTIDQGRLYIDNVGGILAALLALIRQAGDSLVGGNYLPPASGVVQS
jgi:hypothetical protein